jgi:hypothetical protein
MSDTPRTDSEENCYDYSVDIDFARQLERELNAVTAERDALRKAAELGLEYVETELERRKKMVYHGYPSRWELEERYVAEIKAALRGEGEQ